ncbi:hypothetical protein [Streptomyces fragilis]|uniref:Secreted protein n=1 Tax=Streptomyces fragilis TaxID=67301 RepID=A0ABV2YJS7_9ACTN|nr:hypothetical protein [Streptomyces fragilis]
MWVTGGLSASLAVTLTWGAAGAVAAEPQQQAMRPGPAAAAGPGDRCEEDEGGGFGAGPLSSWLSVWGLGDRDVHGCDGEWDRCRDRPLPGPDALPGVGRPDGTDRPDDAGRFDGARLDEGARPDEGVRLAEAGRSRAVSPLPTAETAGTRTGTAPRGITRGGTCETREGDIEVTGELVDVPAGGSATSIATCPYGTAAVAGGWSTSEQGLVPGVSQRFGEDSWRVVFDNPTDEEISGLAFAYCEARRA